MERTYIMLKPDSIKRKLAGKIISRIEEKGYNITNMKMMMLDEKVLKEHYSHIADQPFFPEIVKFMTSGPVIGMIVEGPSVVQGMRNIIGATRCLDADPGSIRGDFAFTNGENLIHGSDTIENAEAEIRRFFGKNA